MLDRPHTRCDRFSGRPEGFGEDASFFFDRAGFGAARWRPRVVRKAPPPEDQVVAEGAGRRLGWALVVIGLILCVAVLVSLVPHFLLHRNRGALSRGFYEQAVQVHKLTPSNGLWVPAPALRYDGDDPSVAVVDDDGVAHFRTVQLGKKTPDEVEVVAGLEGTEALVTPLPDSLHDGMKVLK